MAFKLTKAMPETPEASSIEEARQACLAYIKRLDSRGRSPIREDRLIQDPLVRVCHRLGRVARQAGWYPTSDLERVADALVDALPSHSYISRSGELVQGHYGDPEMAETLRSTLYEGFGLSVNVPAPWYETQEAWALAEVLITTRCDQR